MDPDDQAFLVFVGLLLGAVIIFMALATLVDDGDASELEACADIENVNKSIACFEAINDR